MILRTERTSRNATTLASVTWTETRLGLEVAAGVRDFAHERGWRVLRLDNRAPLSPAALKYNQVRGLVLQAFTDAPINAVLSLGLPAVNVSNSRTNLKLPRVVPDDLRIGRLAADYYLAKGFRHFAYCGDLDSGASELRGRGFAGRLEERGFCVARLCGQFGLTVAYLSQSKIAELTRWLRHLPRPCALLAWNDGVCDTVVNICLHERWRVPEDISILGVNNDFSRLIDNDAESISSIELPGRAIGREAARIVAGLIEGRAPPREPLLIGPVRLVERRSTDFYAVRDSAVAAALRFIRNNYQRPSAVDEVAGAAMLSRRVLEKRFRSLLGFSPYAHILRCRLERAKELLLNTNLKLEEIARLSGYGDGSNFSAFFSGKAGESPSGFRRRGQR